MSPWRYIYIHCFMVFHHVHRPIIDPSSTRTWPVASSVDLAVEGNPVRNSRVTFLGKPNGKAMIDFFYWEETVTQIGGLLYMTLMIEILLRICSCVSCLLCSRWCCEDTTTDAFPSLQVWRFARETVSGWALSVRPFRFFGVKIYSSTSTVFGTSTSSWYWYNLCDSNGWWSSTSG